MADLDEYRITFGDLLDRQAERLGGREALVHVEHGRRYTYTQLRAECDRVARGLMALGIKRGDHVGIWATNYTEWVVAQFATAKIGAVLVTVNPAYRTHELEYVLRQSELSALILIASFRTSDYVAMLNEVVPELRDSAPGELHSDKLPYLRNIVFIPPYPRDLAQDGSRQPNQETPPGMWQWDEVKGLGEEVSQEALAKRQSECDPGDVANILYTSGTTGNPKGAMLTHFFQVANMAFLTDGWHFTEQDRLCIPLPLYHAFGCVIGAVSCVLKGAAMVLPSEYFDPLTTLQALEQERCTAVIGVPAMFIGQLGHPDFDKFDLSAMRTGIMAGAPCPVEVMRQVLDRMGIKEITIGYGQTEALLITLTDSDDTIERRVTTVGKVMPHMEVKLIDPETGQEVAQGEQGELCSRSVMCMNGYYNMPEATAETIDTDGWLHTGDLATVDEDGYYKITGRLKDMVIRGGENIYPAEIEQFLFTHPKIADVQVFGVPDLKFGEELMAWIMLRDGQTATEDEIRDFCRGNISHFKIPRYVKFVSEFPLTVTGKAQKFRMQEMAIEELGLQQAQVETA
ncbi:MAG: AMP-binding protein [Chloroflexi bacterium]|nr:AMP-binding protein [Chloroflexota bacterium]